MPPENDTYLTTAVASFHLLQRRHTQAIAKIRPKVHVTGVFGVKVAGVGFSDQGVYMTDPVGKLHNLLRGDTCRRENVCEVYLATYSFLRDDYQMKMWLFVSAFLGLTSSKPNANAATSGSSVSFLSTAPAYSTRLSAVSG